METVIIILLSLSTIVLGYTTLVLYKKILVFEDEFLKIETELNDTIEAMREIDIRGSFEADDEVGDVFNQMKDLIEYLGEYTYDEKEKRK
jgi:predicted oxidoreductase